MTDHPDDSHRGTTELILGALAGSALLPFIQSVATQAGQDVYQLIRDRLSRDGRRRAKAEIRESGTVTLTARDARVLLKLPHRLTPTMATRLESLRLPVDRGWVQVAWDHQRERWVVESIPEPS